MKKLLLLLLFLFSITSSYQVFAQDKVYLRTNTCGAFWNSNGNEKAMDAVFGSGQWQYKHFETVDVAALLTKDIHFLFIEGSNCGTIEMIAFLNANQSAIEDWVSEGGNLLINAAPNEGPGTVGLGFGDVRLSLVRSGSMGGLGTAVDLEHPIFKGPAAQTGSVWSGSAFAHRQVLGTGLSGIIKDTKSGEVYLAEKEWGNGSVVIGGMTMAYFQEGLQGWAPIQEVSNIHKNLMAYMARGRKVFEAIEETVTDESEEVINPAVGIESLANNSFCLGVEASLAFTTTGTFDAANAFAVQLSDASGDFGSFTIIGELVGVSSGEIKVKVPVNTPAGTNYRIRVVASSPDVASEDYAVTINPLPAITAPASLTLNGMPGVCGATGVQLGTPITTENCVASIVDDAPAIFPLGTTTVTWTITDNAGNIATATQEVTVNGVMPDPAITVTGVGANTIYLGYGSQQATLTASNTTSATYEWSPASGLSSATGATTVFAPTAAGVYMFTVTATNEYGCKASASVTLNVVDVRCGNNNDKVLVCHNGHEICISPNAVQAHLDHGCSVGACSTSEVVGASASAKATVLKAETTELVVFPNPFNETATIEVTLRESGYYRLELLDVKGALVKELAASEGVAGASYAFQLDSSKLLKGIYLVRFVSPGEVKTMKVIYTK